MYNYEVQIIRSLLNDNSKFNNAIKNSFFIKKNTLQNQSHNLLRGTNQLQDMNKQTIQMRATNYPSLHSTNIIDRFKHNNYHFVYNQLFNIFYI